MISSLVRPPWAMALAARALAVGIAARPRHHLRERWPCMAACTDRASGLATGPGSG
ncbi:hypothetical protein [Phytopseudomonas dryadis]|uniref:hypothetical protein n=1 Tax=Phytopseudomonas dryadis TaxID=2487520 RepID=UPI0013F170E5|nr:hypothetical protein [Pseudomonas dryadis]